MALADVLTPADVVARSNGTVELTDPRLNTYVADVLAEATMFAPCLQRDDLSPVKLSQAKAILADAALRRFNRDTIGQESTQVQQETYTFGPATKSITFANGANLGLPLLTAADREFLADICRVKTPQNIPIGIPLVRDPAAAGWPGVPRR